MANTSRSVLRANLALIRGLPRMTNEEGQRVLAGGSETFIMAQEEGVLQRGAEVRLVRQDGSTCPYFVLVGSDEQSCPYWTNLVRKPAGDAVTAPAQEPVGVPMTRETGLRELEGSGAVYVMTENGNPYFDPGDELYLAHQDSTSNPGFQKVGVEGGYNYVNWRYLSKKVAPSSETAPSASVDPRPGRVVEKLLENLKLFASFTTPTERQTGRREFIEMILRDAGYTVNVTLPQRASVTIA